MLLDNYRDRCLNGAKSIKEVRANRAKDAFKNYMMNTPTCKKVQVTEIDEPCITEDTRRLLVSIVDVTNNDKRALDEKNLYFFRDAKVDVGCYLRYDNEDWLIIFKEHDPLEAKLHFIARRCNNYITVKYKDKLYKLPISVENLTMYSDGIADNIKVSYLDSKKQVWYGSNPVTRTIGEGFRMLLTHRTAFRITHINDFEHNGLIKSLIVQTAINSKDDIENRYADNTAFYNSGLYEDETEVEKKGIIIGDTDIIVGEEKEFIFKPKNKKPYKWKLEENNAFVVISESDTNIVIQGAMNMRYIGFKTKLSILDADTEEVINEVELVLRR